MKKAFEDKKSTIEEIIDYKIYGDSLYEDNQVLDYSYEWEHPSIDNAIILLEAHGITVKGEGFNSVSPYAANILIAEAVNCAAKTIDNRFYELKPYIFVEAAEKGANYGVLVHHHDNDNTWNIYHPEVGTVSFHDPGNLIEYLIKEEKVEFCEEYDWSNQERQYLAFETLNDSDILQNIAEKTRPSCHIDTDEVIRQRFTLPSKEESVPIWAR